MDGWTDGESEGVQYYAVAWDQSNYLIIVLFLCSGEGRAWSSS